MIPAPALAHPHRGAVAPAALAQGYALDTLGMTAGPATVNRAHRTLRAILNRALHEERILRNPAIGCDVPAVPMKRNADELADVVWDVPELQAIIRAHPERFRAFVATMATSGLRSSEAIGLRWPNVDVLDGEIHVVEAVTFPKGRPHRGPTKNKRRRTVPLTSGVAAMLVEQRERFGEGPEGAVFTDVKGQLINRFWFLRSVFRPALKAAGVHEGDVSSLRRSASSILRRQPWHRRRQGAPRPLRHAHDGAIHPHPQDQA